MRGYSKKTAMCKSRREASGQVKPVNTLNLDFQLPELSENKFLLFKLPQL